MLTDSHCHLASGQFRKDSGDVIQRAVEQGVTRMVTIGTDCEDSAECIALANNNLPVYAAVGIHPCSVTEITEDENWLEKIYQLAIAPKVAAIGEIGLDYFHPPPEGWSEEAYRKRQADFFRAQLELAAELGLNVVIHQRDKAHQTPRAPWCCARGRAPAPWPACSAPSSAAAQPPVSGAGGAHRAGGGAWRRRRRLGHKQACKVNLSSEANRASFTEKSLAELHMRRSLLCSRAVQKAV